MANTPKIEDGRPEMEDRRLSKPRWALATFHLPSSLFSLLRTWAYEQTDAGDGAVRDVAFRLLAVGEDGRTDNGGRRTEDGGRGAGGELSTALRISSGKGSVPCSE